MSMLRRKIRDYTNRKFEEYGCDPLNMRPIYVKNGESSVVIMNDDGVPLWKSVPEGLEAILSHKDWKLIDALVAATVKKCPSIPQYILSKHPELLLEHHKFMSYAQTDSTPILMLACLGDEKIVIDRDEDDRICIRGESSNALGHVLIPYRARNILKGHTHQMVCLLPPDDSLFWTAIKDRVYLWSAMSHPNRNSVVIPPIDYNDPVDFYRFSQTVVSQIACKEKQGFVGKWILVAPREGLLNSSFSLSQSPGEKIGAVNSGATDLMYALDEAKTKGFIQSHLADVLSYDPPSIGESSISSLEAARIERSFQLINIEKESLRIIPSVYPTFVQLDECRFDIISAVSAYYVPRGEDQEVGILDFIID